MINFKDARLNAGKMVAAIFTDARTPARKSGRARKLRIPRWLNVVWIIYKIVGVVSTFCGLLLIIWFAVVNFGSNAEDFSLTSGDFEGNLSEVEKFVKTTINAMQVHVNGIDRKLEDGISSVRQEFDEKLEKKGDEMDLKLKALIVRSDVFEKPMDGFGTKSLLSKEEFGEFFEEFKKARKKGGSDGDEVSVDEIRDYARQIVEKEIERHAADGLGMVDYVLASAGGRVLRHSEPYGGGGSGVWLVNRNRVSAEAEKVIRPSFGKPGQCFPFKGGSGFIEIRLRAAIVPEAVTLEHVAKSVAYDRSTAPKHCRVSGWMQGRDSIDLEIGTKKVFLLTEFTFDLEKSNAQTFMVEAAAYVIVDTIRLDFTSNHGSASHTCIYQLRVHGYEPSPVATLEMQS
ncbi:hypothetical protein Pfo_016172 [Paulownia fortunei]|nr:hypothetical protein Pfo_016172 [Paulownia fortunei]